MAHVVFIDSSYVGLRAITTARRLGHEVTLVIPAEATMFFVMGLSDEHIAKHLGPNDELIYAEQGNLKEVILSLNDRKRIDAVLTTSEVAVIPTSELAQLIGTIYDDPVALGKAANKNKLRATLQEKGIASTEFATARDMDSALQAANVSTAV